MRTFALFGVHSARGWCIKAPPKTGFQALIVQTPQRRIIILCTKADTAGGYVFLWRRRCGVHRTPTRGIESISRDIHKEDSYYRMAPAIDAKLGALMGNDIVCHGKPPLGVAPSSRERAHV